MRPLRILIVDDSYSVRALISAIVSPFAGDIQECADGADALAAYLLQRPDVVLMDLRMQRVNGLTATKQILAADPNAKVVMVTEHDSEDVRDAAFSAGVCEFASKENLMDLSALLERFQFTAT